MASPPSTNREEKPQRTRMQQMTVGRNTWKTSLSRGEERCPISTRRRAACPKSASPGVIGRCLRASPQGRLSYSLRRVRNSPRSSRPSAEIASLSFPATARASTPSGGSPRSSGSVPLVRFAGAWHFRNLSRKEPANEISTATASSAIIHPMKPHAPTAAPAEKGKLHFGLPGSAKERSGKIKAAIQANRETLRRLAK